MPPKMTDEKRSDPKKTVAAAIERIERGVQTVKIPPARELLRRLPDTHFHLACELNLMISGTAVIGTPGQNTRLAENDILILPKGIPHRAEAGRPSRGDFRMLAIEHHHPGTILLITAEEGQHRRPALLDSRHVRKKTGLRSAEFLDEVVNAYETRPPKHRELKKGLLLAYFSGLYDLLSDDPPAKKRENEKVARCRELVMVHLAERDLAVARIAKWLQLAPDYLSHLFATETGITLKTYINRERVRLAEHLLADPTLNVSEAAWAAGFSDPGYFTRVFKRINGQAPREFRALS